jgi:hypothetical protein
MRDDGTKEEKKIIKCENWRWKGKRMYIKIRKIIGITMIGKKRNLATEES